MIQVCLKKASLLRVAWNVQRLRKRVSILVVVGQLLFSPLLIDHQVSPLIWVVGISQLRRLEGTLKRGQNLLAVFE
jgi:hypothetical protein